MKVNVTRKCIAEGKRRSTVYCPVAIAVRNAAPYHWSVRVGSWDIIVGGAHYLLPKRAQEFIRRFDRTGKGSPFTFIARRERLR